MQFTAIVALALGPLLAGASALPSASPTNYGFVIFQDADCSNAAGNMTVAGSTKSPQACSPPPEYGFGSVLVHSDAGGKCSIGFYSGTTDKGKCAGKLVSAPGAITVGKCFTFNTTDTPETYGITC